MMDDRYPEIFLDLGVGYEPNRGEAFSVRVLDRERSLFEPGGPARTFSFTLPRAFRETALTQSPQDAWHAAPLNANPAYELGQRMWRSLPNELQERISTSLSLARPLLLKFGSASSGIDDVPWEWLYGPGPVPLGLHMGARMVRCLPVLHASPPLTVTPPLRVLIVLTNPRDERLLDAPTEIGIVQGGLSDPAQYTVQTIYEPGIASLQRALEWEPSILHYVGHSGITTAGGNLIMHDSDGGTAWVSAAQLAKMLPASVRLLCLSTCVTAQNFQIGGLRKFAHAPAEVLLPTIIVNQYALTRESAAAFWRKFYPALIAVGGDPIEAVQQARHAAADAQPNFIDWASFSLVLRDGHLPAFRIAPAVAEDPSRMAEELQAQFAARLANSLADQLRYVTPDKGVSDRLRSSIEDASKTFSDITRKLS
jgi:CHAT domain-containing protein